MNIDVSAEAAKWYKEELDAGDGTQIRFFVRYGGCSNIQTGFSLGVSMEEPINPVASAEIDGLMFYIEEKDLWYFDGKDIEVSFNEKINEPVFNYH